MTYDIDTQDSRRARARMAVEEAIGRHLELLDPMANRGVDTDDILRRPNYEPTAFAKAARKVAELADALARDAVRKARGEGRSWDQVAVMLDIEGVDGAEMAWDFAATTGNNVLAGDRRYVHWRCSTCGGFVRDQAVWVGGEEAEQGHEPGCPRYLADIDAWNRHWAELEDSPE